MMARKRTAPTRLQSNPARCPALATARQIDRHQALIDELQRRVFKASKNDPVRDDLCRAQEVLAHKREAALSALVFTRAESVEGALAKAFIAYGIFEFIVSTPIEAGWEQDHYVFLARSLMQDARSFLEAHHGVSVRDCGAGYWYSEDLEPDAREAAFSDNTARAA